MLFRFGAVPLRPVKKGTLLLLIIPLLALFTETPLVTPETGVATEFGSFGAMVGTGTSSWSRILTEIADLAARERMRKEKTKLGAAPVTAFGVVADGVVSPHTDPVRNWPVLPLLLRQLLLDHEGLVGRL
ncbi:hypothetical protein M9H77_15596 [Catharanthus roseus]|uniref:Uncharacterized protein n=1 Tax=Catharanthus roseus TaxID=4058 RepID=A0ACC0AXN4_CATRO|nr:hypothetical protein M9H77_15596 [Catharanthus roseus]